MGSSQYDWCFLLDVIDLRCFEYPSFSSDTAYAAGGGGGGESRVGDSYRG